MAFTTPTTALVTGANKGIGLAVVKLLVRDLPSGSVVYLACRDIKRGEAAAELLRGEFATADKQPGAELRVVQLDVTDLASVAACAAAVAASTEGGALDVLVNNAGIAQSYAGPSGTSDAELRDVFAVNFLGPAAAVREFLPLLRRSPAPRVVNVTSALGSLTRASDKTWHAYSYNVFSYAASKAALNYLTVSLAKELASSLPAAKVNSVEPGYTATDLTQGQGLLKPEEAAATVVRYALLPEDGPTGGFFDENGELPW
ncbi:hypothetical protein HK405_001770 [Cladochytrium tenue]|nr:hypothetical protein HK405_001770 [Cladochytrium tenue]